MSWRGTLFLQVKCRVEYKPFMVVCNKQIQHIYSIYCIPLSLFEAHNLDLMDELKCGEKNQVKFFEE